MTISEYRGPEFLRFPDFAKKLPLEYRDVTAVVFRTRQTENGEEFWLGFLPYGEFIFHIRGFSPDVTFAGLPIERVYHEPYRTFLYLSEPSNLRMEGSAGVGKLSVSATEGAEGPSGPGGR